MEQLLNILTEIVPGVDFTGQTALVDDGLIDSFDLVNIVAEIMDAFDVELDIDSLTPENFNSVEAIWKLIERSRA